MYVCIHIIYIYIHIYTYIYIYIYTHYIACMYIITVITLYSCETWSPN